MYIVCLLGGPGAGMDFIKLTLCYSDNNCHIIIANLKGKEHKQSFWSRTSISSIYRVRLLSTLQYLSNQIFHPAGELLRKECARPDSPHAAFIKERIAQGDVVPYKLIMSLVKSEMSSALRSDRWANGIGRFILDGFPRDLDQAHSFDSEVSAFVSEFQIH